MIFVFSQVPPYRSPLIIELCVCVCVQDPATIGPIQSQVTLLVRASYSNPPAHGARIVHTVLHDPALYQASTAYILTPHKYLPSPDPDLQESVFGKWIRIQTL